MWWLPFSQLVAADRDHAAAAGSAQALRLFENGQRGGVLFHEKKRESFVVPRSPISWPECNRPIKAGDGFWVAPGMLFQKP